MEILQIVRTLKQNRYVNEEDGWVKDFVNELNVNLKTKVLTR